MSDECDSLRYMRKIARANFSNDSGLDLRTPQLLLCDFSTDSYLPKPDCPPMCVHAHACARGWHQVFFLRSCRLDWPRIQWFPCACLLSAGIKGACLHCLACELTFIRHVLWLFFFSDVQTYKNIFMFQLSVFFFRSMWVKTALCPLPVSACWAAARATFSLLCLPAVQRQGGVMPSATLRAFRAPSSLHKSAYRSWPGLCWSAAAWLLRWCCLSCSSSHTLATVLCDRHLRHLLSQGLCTGWSCF